MSSSPSEPELLVSEESGIGRLILNRPRQLNALTAIMCRDVLRLLRRWAADPAIRLVVIEGAGDRAFCAGGDVVNVWHAGQAAKRGEAPTEGMPFAAFFHHEYRMNAAIAALGKPYVALLDGVTMGGGCGISLHGSHPVATERTLFAMPETGIGLFPDVGMMHPLTRLADHVGLWLALLGARLGPGDLLALGLVRAVVPSSSLDEVRAALALGEDPDAVLARFALTPEPETLTAERRALIRHCFDPDLRVEEICARLEGSGDGWAAAQAEAMAKLCPTSLVLTRKHYGRSRGLALPEVLARDYVLVQRCLEGTEFYEGVRALLIDKDKAPRWSPARTEDVPPLTPWFEEPSDLFEGPDLA